MQSLAINQFVIIRIYQMIKMSDTKDICTHNKKTNINTNNKYEN